MSYYTNGGVGHTNSHKRYINDGVHKTADFLYHMGWGDDLTCRYVNRELHARLPSFAFNDVLFEFRLSAIHIPHEFPHTPMSDVRVFPIKTGKIDIFICPRRDTSGNWQISWISLNIIKSVAVVVAVVRVKETVNQLARRI